MRALKESVRNYRAFLFMLLCISPSYLQGLTAGSNTATTIQTFLSFPQTDTNNTMLGFGRFSSGFQLISPQTTCTFNDFFPVGGPVYLDGGTLYLSEDVKFSAGTQIMTGGTINGQRHAIIFQDTGTSTIPIQTGNSLAAWQLGTGQANNQPVKSVGWTYDDKYAAIVTGYGIPGVNPGRVYLFSFNGTQLTNMTYTFWTPIIYCFQWHPTVYLNPTAYLFAMGGFYSGAQRLMIVRWTPSINDTHLMTSVVETTTAHGIDWNSSGTYLLESLETSPYLKIYAFNPTTTALGSSWTATGHPVYDPTYGIYNTVSWSPTSSYFAAISTDTSHALTIYSFTGTFINEIVSATADHLPSAVSWSPTSSFIAVTFYDSTPTYSWLRVYQFTPPSTLQQVISYPQTSSGYATAVKWRRDGTQIAAGVMDTSGSFVTFNTFAFNPSLSTLSQLWASSNLRGTCGFYLPITSSDWTHSDNYLLAGLSCAGWGIVYGYFYNPPAGTVFNNANLKFSGDVYLNTPPIVFQGTCILDGNNCNLYLGYSGITVASGSSLLLKDLTIYNITGTNINCVDNTSTISFNNVVWSQDSDMTFTQGQLAITGEFAMTGGHQFIYQSDQISTIYDHATWYFDTGMTFSYAPAHGANNLIVFQNNASMLYLYGTTLHAPSTGLRLTKGCLTIDGPCPFMSDSTTETNGIWIGDGTTADDVKVKILAESGIIVGSGYVSYRNTK